MKWKAGFSFLNRKQLHIEILISAWQFTGTYVPLQTPYTGSMN